MTDPTGIIACMSLLAFSRTPEPRYRDSYPWKPHDGSSPYFTCGDCGLTVGPGITTPHDEAWFGGDDGAGCPACHGELGMSGDIT